MVMRDDPRTVDSQWKRDKTSRALIAGDKEPVPGSVCYGGRRARWGNSECAAMLDKF